MAANMTGYSMPERDSIHEVMSSCACDELQAVNLLQRSNNDVEKAKHRYLVLKKFINVPPTQPESDPDDSGDSGDSGDEQHYVTPRTDEEPLLGSTTSPQRFSDVEFRLKRPFDEVPVGFGQRESSTITSNSSSSQRHSKIDSMSSQRPSDNGSTSALHQEAESESDLQHTNIQKDETEETSAEKYEWDFVLPRIPYRALTPGVGEYAEGFNPSDLVGAIQQGVSMQVIQNYLGYYHHNTIRQHINDAVQGFPAIFFAVATNSDWIVRTWIAYGGNVNAIHEDSQVPLLAFAIVLSESIMTDTTHIVATLLSFGAVTSVIPKAFFTPYCRDLPDNGPDDDSLGDLSPSHRAWLTKTARAKLARTINLTHRYNLERATKTKKPSMRHRQVAYRKNAEALLGLPYFLIGQSMAANQLLQKCLSYLAVPGKRPLVLVFAGPSGHGKTELARRLGYLMSLELEVVDCTIVNREIELFGGRHPYVNAEHGTPLNNFLARHSGQRCIVFLDEFEKTTREIHQALLLPFDNGEYQDRRNLNKIDCSKTIWILASNALDTTIENFCKLNDQAIFHDEDDGEKMRLMKQLSKELKEDFLSKFEAPITGRISAFIPFLQFSHGEQAVVAHKYLLELGQDVRNPVDLSTGLRERLIGNIRLRVRRDASVCRNIAEDGYHPALGARSLITAVGSIRELLIDSYLGVDELITESDGMVEFVVDVHGSEIVANMVQGQASAQDEDVEG